MRSIAVALVLLSASVAEGQGASLVIDHVDISGYAATGHVRLFVDLLDAGNKPIPKQAKDKLRFYVNDAPADARVKAVKLALFKDTGLPLAIGVLTTDYAGFVPAPVGELSLFGFAKTGSGLLIKRLRPRVDHFSMWLYNEVGHTPAVAFTKRLDQAEKAVGALSEIRVLFLPYGQRRRRAAAGGAGVPRVYACPSGR